MYSPYQTTLLDVVHTISAMATNDEEIVAAVTYLVNSGKIRLCGTFAGARIDLTVPAPSPMQTAVSGHVVTATPGASSGGRDSAGESEAAAPLRFDSHAPARGLCAPGRAGRYPWLQPEGGLLAR